MSALEIEMHRPVVVTDGGPWAVHDVACAVCRERKAVIDLGTGIFQPCWQCQDQGWATAKLPKYVPRGLRERLVSP